VRFVRRYPLTVAAVAVVTVCFALQWFVPLVTALERNPDEIAAGQWWRVVSSFLVQGEGWGQYLFNTLGLAVLGAAVERLHGRVQWFATALVAQAGTVGIDALWHPHASDSGSSLVVAGFAGMLTLTPFVDPRAWALGARAYTVFFATYLATLALAGPVAGAITGSVLAGATVTVLHRSRFAPAATTTVAGVVVAATAVLVVVRDAHGAALALGLACGLLAMLVGRGRRSRLSGRSDARS
jgi:membrane associated rhomboid family serine protease